MIYYRNMFRYLVIAWLALFSLVSKMYITAQDRGLSVIAKDVSENKNYEIGKQWAVIIGIDKYKEWPALGSAVKEARSVENELRERYYIDEFRTLYDEAATAANIRALFMRDLPSRVGIHDSILVFYAGHGYIDSSNTGFWIACDGSKDLIEQNNWIANNQLRNMIGGLQAQRILILADACFSGDFIDAKRGAAPVIDSEYFKNALSYTARQVLTSGASESVPDQSEFGNALLNYLKRNEDQCIDTLSIYDRIRKSMTKSTPLYGTLTGNEAGSSFVFFLKQSPSEPQFPQSAQVPAKAESPMVPASGVLAAKVEPSQQGAIVCTAKPMAGDEAPKQFIGTIALAPGVYIVEARLSDDIQNTFQKIVSVDSRQTINLAIPTLSYSNPYRIGEFQAQKAVLAERLPEAREGQRRHQSTGLAWLLIGVGAAGGATGAYFAGASAYSDYQTATTSAALASSKSNTELFAGLATSLGVAAVVSLALSPTQFFRRPADDLQRQIVAIDEQIKALK
jgi:hypothetical protein